MTHNDPEQAEPRSIKLATDALIDAGDKLSFAAQTSGGTAGRDDALVAAIGIWSEARDKLKFARRIEKYEPDTASPPSHQELREAVMPFLVKIQAYAAMGEEAELEMPAEIRAIFTRLIEWTISARAALQSQPTPSGETK